MSTPAAEVPWEITVEEARDLLATSAGQVALIDVREPAEYETARIAGSRLIPLGKIPENLPQLPADKHLLIHCHHGGRSLRVTQFLRANGLARVSNVAGGIHAWSQRIDPAIPTY